MIASNSALDKLDKGGEVVETCSDLQGYLQKMKTEQQRLKKENV